VFLFSAILKFMIELFDLSTPEGRQDRGIYDEKTDPYITEEMRQRAANYISGRGFAEIKVEESDLSKPVE
jgi:hypothetical protein